mgnify:CR=1 FL=1
MSDMNAGIVTRFSGSSDGPLDIGDATLVLQSYLYNFARERLVLGRMDDRIIILTHSTWPPCFSSSTIR